MSVTIPSAAANPVVKFRDEIVRMTPEFANALPSHIKPEKFQRVLMTVVQQTPDLLKADRRSLFAACLKCAADGLIPDGREAALVVYSNKIQYQPMFMGIQKRARNSGEIAGLIAQVVYEKDEFVQRPEDFDNPIHHRPPALGSDRGRPIGAYALAKLKDGTVVSEVMDVAEIEKIRAVSRAAQKGPWVQWWDQMARKTVFKRMSKWLPLDADVDALIRHDNAVEAAPLAPVAGVDEIEGSAEIPIDDFEAAGRGITLDSATADGEDIPSGPDAA